MEPVTSQKMTNCGVFWCIVFFIVVKTSIFALNCSGIHKCYCQPISEDTVQISCKDSIFTIQMITNSEIMVACLQGSLKKIEVDITSFQENQVNSLRFKNCLFTQNIRINEITHKLGIANVKNLNYTLPKNLIFPTKRTGLKKLYFARNMIHTPHLLANMSDLTHLKLWKNNIGYIPVEFFNYVPQLEYLHLTGDLSFIEPGVFDNHKQLKTLHIESTSEYLYLPPGIFYQLTALESLFLSSFYLSSLPEDIFAKLENLRNITLHYNYSGELSRNLLRNNTKLQIVNIYNQDNENNLTTMPSGYFSNFTELKELKLKKIRFLTLPYDLFWGSFSLVAIDLTQNRLKSLPQDIFRDAKQLISLDLDMNNLEELSDYIFNYTNNLETLSLSRNQIRFISKYMFHGLFKLRELNLEYNSLTTISDTSLDSILNLQIARFSNNNLMLQSFKNINTKLSNLNELYLAHNNIADSFRLDMIKLAQLKVLDLTYNEISLLNITCFGPYYPNRILIDLTHNKIEHIDEEDKICKGRKRLPDDMKTMNITILVANNQLICDCSYYDRIYAMELLRMSSGSISEIYLIDTTCHSPKWLENMKVRDLQSNTFECMAEDADMDFACPRECACILRPEDKAFKVDCSRKNLTNVPSDVKDPGKPYKFIGLNFSYNMLEKMPNLAELNLQSAKLLDLSYNNISEISQDGLSDAVEVLKLHNNNISRIRLDVLEFLQKSTNLTNLTLHGNPWKCDCDAKDFLNFVKNFEKNFSLHEMKCLYKDYSISQMTVDEFCPDEMDPFIGISVLIPVVLIPIVGIIIGVFGIYYRYQRNIKVWLFARRWCLYCVTEEELDKEKLYDAFISYSHKDQDFVENELIPTLESGPKPFKLCLHYRDWIAGEWIPTQIVKSVEDSRRTIVVLSSNFLDSVWGRMEFRAAHTQALRESRARVILILYGDIIPTDDMDPELKLYLNMNTYIKWGDPWFWDKLRYALPHRPRVVRTNEWEIFENYEMN